MARKQKNSHLDLDRMAELGRNAIKYGVIGLVLYIVLRFSWSTATNIYLQLNPPGPPAPTMGFGRLPKPDFPAQLAQERPDEIVLETVGQRFPGFGTQIPVYYVPESTPDLLALDRAKQKAATLGFLFEPEKVTSRLYRWRRTTPLPAILEMDIVDGTFEMNVDWASSVSLLEKKIIPDERQANNELRSTLRKVNLFSEDLATASAKVTFLRALAGQTKQANSINEADFVRADLYRSVPNGLDTVTSEYQHGVIRALFSGSREQGERLLYLQSSYLPVNWQRPETYPLQSAAEAWQQLLAGEGYITNAGNDVEAVVRSVRLAYFEPMQDDSYFQPVFVFEGDDDFQALVPALNLQVYQPAQ